MMQTEFNRPGSDAVTRLSPTIASGIDLAPTIVIPVPLSPEPTAAKEPKLVVSFRGRGHVLAVPQNGKRTLGGPDMRRKDDVLYSVIPGIEIETEFATLHADSRGVVMTLAEETAETVTVFSAAPPHAYAAGESFYLDENSRLRLGPLAEAVFTQLHKAPDDQFEIELTLRYLGEVSCEISRQTMQRALDALRDAGTHPATTLTASGLVSPEAWYRASTKGAAMVAIERSETTKRRHAVDRRSRRIDKLVGAMFGAAAVGVSLALVALCG